jgi:alkyl hydroperoxide reductase subunit AhpC
MKKILVIASTMLFGLIGANAAMTAPGVNINNTATLSYDVGGVNQTDVNASDAGFVVDRKIDVQVANTDTDKSVDVTPSAADQELHFTIANLGNDQEEYTLSYADIAAGDQYDPTNCQIDAGAGFVNFTTTITIAAETNATVVVQCDIPAQGTVHNDDNGTIVLTATVNGRTKANDDVDDPAVVQDVYADGAGETDAVNNGDHSDRGTYHVVSADLSLVKTSIVTEDPVHAAGGAAQPHRIPGATVRYCFVVDNNGSANASNVNITDDFTADNKDKLTVVNAGHVVQANTTACDCAGIADTSGTTGTTSAITTGADTVNANQRMCAYIEATVN